MRHHTELGFYAQKHMIYMPTRDTQRLFKILLAYLWWLTCSHLHIDFHLSILYNVPALSEK